MSEPVGVKSPDALFTQPVRLEAGIYRALERNPRVPLAQSSNFWPLTAALYEPLWRRRSLGLLTGGSFSTERELALMLEWLKPQAGEVILDAATSAGLYARTLLAREPSLTIHALDFSLPFLKKAGQYAAQSGVKAVLVQADVRALPYREGVFDALVCGGSLNEFTDLPRTLGEFSRVLKPGGRMWLMYLSRAQSLPGRSLQGTVRLSGIRFVDAAALEAQALEAGIGLLRAQHRGRVTLALFAKR